MTELERIRQHSIEFIENLSPEEQDELINVGQGWTSYGDRINEMIHRGTFKDRQFKSKMDQQQHLNLMRPYIETLNGLLRLFEDSQIITEEDIILSRGTLFPNIQNDVFLSATSRKSTAESFGEIYKLRIPRGTPIFYISAVDLILKHMPHSETEKEFLLYPGTTKKSDIPGFMDYIQTDKDMDTLVEYFNENFTI